MRIFKIAIFPFLLFNFSLMAFNCQITDQINQSRLKTCEHNNKKFYALELSGESFKKLHYDHGYLLNRKIEEGALSEAIGNIQMLLSQASATKKVLFNSILNCLKQNFDSSLSSEFQSGMSGIFQGMKRRAKLQNRKVRFSYDEFKTANYSIEYGNILVGLMHDFEKEKVKTALKLINTCKFKYTQKMVKDVYEAVRYLSGVNKSGKSMINKFACSGATATQSNTTNKEFIHIRNLEQTTMMKTWNKAPVIFMVKQKNKIPYVAYGTAGMIFPGGISGYNEKGITVSLHQLNAETYSFKTKSGNGDIMPFIQQRILAEANNIDEAIAIVKKAGRFSSWIILVGDAKNNESATIEASNEKVIVSQRKKHKPVVISNHFLSAKMQKHHFHKSMSFYMETTARFSLMNNKMKDEDGTIGPQFMIELMANHYDVYAQEDRLFGRSLARASNIMTTMAIPQHNMSYITLGDHEAPNHGTYLGFRSDFKKGTLKSVDTMSPKTCGQYCEATKYYVAAYREYNVGDKSKALPNLLKANELLNGDDPHLLYVIGKMYLTQKNYELSIQYLEDASSKSGREKYLKARADLYALFAKKASNSYGIAFSQKIATTKSYFNSQSIQQSFESVTGQFPIHGADDLKRKRELLAKIESGTDLSIEEIGGVNLSSID